MTDLTTTLPMDDLHHILFNLLFDLSRVKDRPLCLVPKDKNPIIKIEFTIVHFHRLSFLHNAKISGECKESAGLPCWVIYSS